jgi:hypothetical protein
MKSQLNQLLFAMAAVVLVVFAWWLVRLEPARSAARMAVAREQAVAKDLLRLTALQGHEAQVVAQRLPDNDLVTRLQPIAEQVDPISRLRQRRVQVRLHGLSPAQLGGWLAAWSTAEQPWLVESLGMTHALDSAPAAAGGGIDSNTFTISVVLLTRSVEDSP